MVWTTSSSTGALVAAGSLQPCRDMSLQVRSRMEQLSTTVTPLCVHVSGALGSGLWINRPWKGGGWGNVPLKCSWNEFWVYTNRPWRTWGSIALTGTMPPSSHEENHLSGSSMKFTRLRIAAVKPEATGFIRIRVPQGRS
jgi:hypothetical protein